MALKLFYLSIMNSVAARDAKILEMFGYRVLVATQGRVEAQNLFSANKSEIAL